MKESKAGATSSHTIKARGGCLKHNRRTFNAPNVIPAKTYLNQSWESEEIKNIKTIRTLERRAEKIYTEKVGQKCQKSFAPYRESVVVIRENSTMKQAHDFKARVEAIIPGIKCVGIWMHKDEGYWRSKYIEGDEDFKCNYHVHFLWYCQNPTTGKAIPIKRADMRKMQDCAAAAFKMERGNIATETKRKWMDGNEYKKKKETERATKLAEQNAKAKQDLSMANETMQKVREEKMQIEEAVVKGKVENAKVQKENKVLQDANAELNTANKDLTAKKEQSAKELADLEVKGEKTRAAYKDEETKLRNIQSKTKEEQQRLDILIDDGEKAQKGTPHFSYAAFDPTHLIPTIPTPPMTGRESWVKQQNSIIEKRCEMIAEKARELLISTITRQDETIAKLGEAVTAANKKSRLLEQRTEKETLIEKAVKAICDFFSNHALRPSAENAIHDAYVAFLKDFFGDSTLGRSLIKEANLRIENGVRKQTSDPKLLQACQDLLGKMWEKAVFLLREVLHMDEREEENQCQYRR